MKTMRTILIAATIALLPICVTAQTGIQFVSYDWEEVLEMAQEQNRYIFVDAYATWCGPCKYLKNNVFPDEELGDFYNDKFINVSYAIDKGEGEEFAAAYPVRAYPSLYYFTPWGELALMEMGARDAQGLIALGQKAMNPDNHQFKMKEKYENGDRSLETVKAYLEQINDEETYDAVIDDYMENLDASDMSDEKKAFVLSNTDEYGGPGYMFTLKNLDAFGDYNFEGIDAISVVTYYYIMELAGIYTEGEDAGQAEQMLAEIEDNAPELVPPFRALDKLLKYYAETSMEIEESLMGDVSEEEIKEAYDEMYKKLKNMILEHAEVLDDEYIYIMFSLSMLEDPEMRKEVIDKVAKGASKETMKKIYTDEIYTAMETDLDIMVELIEESAETYFWDDASELNDYAWFMLDYPDEVDNYDLILRMAKRSIELDETHYVLDTYARALYESGDKQLAIKMQEKAIRMAENDPDMTEEYVDQLRETLETYK